MKLCIIGTGYVGLVSGACFSDLGNNVICVDNNVNKIQNLQKGIIPIYEPGLEELVQKNYKAGRLNFSSNLKYAINQSNIIFICVGTPNKKKSYSADLSQIYKVAKQIRKYIKKFKIIITKSTVPVTTGDILEKLISQKKSKKLFEVVSNPEFLREGEAIRDFMYPDRIVIGTDKSRVNNILKNLYEPITKRGAKYLNTSRKAAELIKYSSNAFLATKISYINEISNLCEKVGVNIEDVSIGMGLDQRIGSRFLRAGPGYGGSCLPKDTRAILNTAKKFNISLSIIKSTVLSNNQRHKILFDKICKIMNGNISKKKIAFLGVTFKPNTDDMRESPALKLIPKLHKNGAIISYYDPSGMKNNFVKYKNVNFVNKISLACKNSDLVILHTEWNEFRNLNFKKLVKKNKFVIYDMRNIYSHKKKVNRNINYYGIGR
jgi:UDPglucose 6-dehydrogenase